MSAMMHAHLVVGLLNTLEHPNMMWSHPSDGLVRVRVARRHAAELAAALEREEARIAAELGELAKEALAWFALVGDQWGGPFLFQRDAEQWAVEVNHRRGWPTLTVEPPREVHLVQALSLEDAPLVLLRRLQGD